MKKWVSRMHGRLSYRVTQFLTGHGCFASFLYRIGKERVPDYPFCDEATDTVEHVGFLLSMGKRTSVAGGGGWSGPFASKAGSDHVKERLAMGRIPAVLWAKEAKERVYEQNPLNLGLVEEEEARVRALTST